MSKATLLEKLTDKEYRDAFVSEEIDVGLPMQLRAMREGRNWKQTYVAEKTRTKQPRFSLMEKPGYGKFSLNTLKKLASLFDVGLVVSFVPFSEMIDFVEGLSPKRLAIPAFADEYIAMHRRFSRALGAGRDADTTTNTQRILDFAGTLIPTESRYATTDADAAVQVSGSAHGVAVETDDSPEPDVELDQSFGWLAEVTAHTSNTARIAYYGR